MKILQINNHHSNVGGAETVYFNTIKLLADKGHEVIAFSRYNDKTFSTFKNEYFVKYSSSYLSKLFNKEAASSLEKLLIKEKPDIAHVHNLVGGLTLSILPVLKKYNVPTVMTVHDFRLKCPVSYFMDRNNLICEKCKNGNYYHCIVKNCSQEGLFKSISISVESYLRELFFTYHSLIDNFIFVSDFVLNKFIEIDPQIENKSTRIYNFTTVFNESSERDNYFLYLGRLVREKGLITLIDAFKELNEQNLKIAGEGPLKPMLEAEINNYDNIEILGFKSGLELENLIKRASFIIIPSECYETLSMTAIEAFAFSKPVIGTNIGALAELIEHGSNGYLFEPRNSNMLKKIISDIQILTKEDYSKLSLLAYKKGIKNFTPEKYYNQLIDLYFQTINKKNLNCKLI